MAEDRIDDDENPEWTDEDFARAMLSTRRKRLMRGEFRSGDDVAALRRWVGRTEEDFARALGINIDTLRDWEQDRCRPDGPALTLLRLIARHPRLVRESLESAA